VLLRRAAVAKKEYLLMENQKSDMAFLAGLVAGAIVGGAVAAFLAPHSGPETREQIAERGLVLKSRAEDVVERAQRVAGETVAKVQVAAQDMLHRSPSAESDSVEGAGI
jgi:gas vesicle protein